MYEEIINTDQRESNHPVEQYSQQKQSSSKCSNGSVVLSNEDRQDSNSFQLVNFNEPKSLNDSVEQFTKSFSAMMEHFTNFENMFTQQVSKDKQP